MVSNAGEFSPTTEGDTVINASRDKRRGARKAQKQHREIIRRGFLFRFGINLPEQRNCVVLSLVTPIQLC